MTCTRKDDVGSSTGIEIHRTGSRRTETGRIGYGSCISDQKHYCKSV